VWRASRKRTRRDLNSILTNQAFQRGGRVCSDGLTFRNDPAVLARRGKWDRRRTFEFVAISLDKT